MSGTWMRAHRLPGGHGRGTGTAEFDVGSGVYTEIQPGSYLFLDGHYGANEWMGQFRPVHSLFIAATVMSTARPGVVVCDVGLKTVAVDSGLPRLWSRGWRRGAALRRRQRRARRAPRCSTATATSCWSGELLP
ncbi:hypothetical protein ACU4GD_21125 [Cupriavidus basilensis]